MKVKIISNGGSPLETKVINAETGERIENVTEIEILISALTMKTEARLIIRDIQLEFEGEMRKINSVTGREIL